MRVRALAYSIVGCAAALALTWDLGRAGAPQLGTPDASAPAPGAPSNDPTGSPSAPASSAHSHTPAPSSSSHRPSGTFAGTTADTQYGPMQVAIVVKNGRISDVQALQSTNRGGRSVAISRAAEPELRTEALRAQSARIDAVSGATYTSDGYRRSLQSAIDKAGL